MDPAAAGGNSRVAAGQAPVACAACGCARRAGGEPRCGDGKGTGHAPRWCPALARSLAEGVRAQRRPAARRHRAPAAPIDGRYATARTDGAAAHRVEPAVPQWDASPEEGARRGRVEPAEPDVPCQGPLARVAALEVDPEPPAPPDAPVAGTDTVGLPAQPQAVFFGGLDPRLRGVRRDARSALGVRPGAVAPLVRRPHPHPVGRAVGEARYRLRGGRAAVGGVHPAGRYRGVGAGLHRCGVPRRAHRRRGVVHVVAPHRPRRRRPRQVHLRIARRHRRIRRCCGCFRENRDMEHVVLLGPGSGRPAGGGGRGPDREALVVLVERVHDRREGHSGSRQHVRNVTGRSPRRHRQRRGQVGPQVGPLGPVRDLVAIPVDGRRRNVRPEQRRQGERRTVNEGESVTITAHLTEALSAAVKIPLTATFGSGPAASHEIPIAASQTSGTLAIVTPQDDNSANEVLIAFQSYGLLPRQRSRKTPR